MRLLLMAPAALLLVACSSELEVSPSELPDGTVGQQFEALIEVSNNETPLGGANIVSGAIPPGLGLDEVENDNTLPIRGVPEQAGTFRFEIELWCYGTNFSGQSARRSYDIAVR
jgi:hypothetical protein